MPLQRQRISLINVFFSLALIVGISFFLGYKSNSISTRNDKYEGNNNNLNDLDKTSLPNKIEIPIKNHKSINKIANMEHLMLDIQLQKKFQRQNLLQDLIKELSQVLKLSILSYHCINDDEYCTALLKEGHVFLNFLTNNELIIDILTSATETPLLSKLGSIQEVIENTFSMITKPAIDNSDIIFKWAYKMRSEDSVIQQTQVSRNLKAFRLSSMKDDVISISEEEGINAYQISDYVDGKIVNTSLLFEDGELQIPYLTDNYHHESLVHPGMLANEDAQDVLIIGGSDGSTLKEVLKHNTVNEITILVPDPSFIELAENYFPERSDCSDLIGFSTDTSSTSCFDDNRVDIIYQDIKTWLQERAKISYKDENKFDVIIIDSIDSSDPTDEEKFVFFTENHEVIDALYNILFQDGVVITQLGPAPQSYHPSEDLSVHAWRLEFLDTVREYEWETMIQYEIFSRTFSMPWSFLVICKTKYCRENWFLPTAHVDIALHQRLVGTHSKKQSLQHFDSGVMKLFQMPSKASEVVYCRRDPAPLDCKILSTYSSLPNAQVTSFEVRPSTIGEGAGRGIFTKVDIPQNTLITFEKAQLNVKIYPKTKEIIDDFIDIETDVDFEKVGEIGPYAVYSYMYSYGFSVFFYGGEAYFVDGSIMTFVNHGCNKTDNLGYISEMFCPECTDLNEAKFSLGVNESDIFEALGGRNFGLDDFDSSPAYIRHVDLLSSAFDYTKTHVYAGDEIFQNYLTYESDDINLLEVAQELKSVCSGEAVGEVAKYESGQFIDVL